MVKLFAIIQGAVLGVACGILVWMAIFMLLKLLVG